MSSCTLGTDPWAPVGTPLRQRESKSDTACASHQKLIDEQMIARGSPESNRLTAHSGHHIQGPRHQSADTVASANKPTEIRPSAGRAGGISLRSPTSACDVATRGEGSGNAISSDGPRRFHCTSSTSTGDPILAASHQLLLPSAEKECLVLSARVARAGRTDGGRCVTPVIERTLDPTTWLIVTGWGSTEAKTRNGWSGSPLPVERNQPP
jgi:hypothetical protein